MTQRRQVAMVVLGMAGLLPFGCEQRHEKVVVVEQPPPRAVVVQPAPRAVVVQPAPQPVIVERHPRPVIVQPAPRPIIVERHPRPVVVQPAPRPIIVERDRSRAVIIERDKGPHGPGAPHGQPPRRSKAGPDQHDAPK